MKADGTASIVILSAACRQAVCGAMADAVNVAVQLESTQRNGLDAAYNTAVQETNLKTLEVNNAFGERRNRINASIANMEATGYLKKRLWVAPLLGIALTIGLFATSTSSCMDSLQSGGISTVVIGFVVIVGYFVLKSTRRRSLQDNEVAESSALAPIRMRKNDIDRAFRECGNALTPHVASLRNNVQTLLNSAGDETISWQTASEPYGYAWQDATRRKLVAAKIDAGTAHRRAQELSSERKAADPRGILMMGEWLLARCAGALRPERLTSPVSGVMESILTEIATAMRPPTAEATGAMHKAGEEFKSYPEVSRATG